jgi:hypothetical protein
MAKKIGKAKDVTDAEEAILSEFAEKANLDVEELVDKHLDALVQEAKRSTVDGWWNSLTIEQKLEVYNDAIV